MRDIRLKLFVTLIICSILYSCGTEDSDAQITSQAKRDMQFKQWVRDTLQSLKNLQIYPNEKIKLDEDSLMLVMDKDFSVRIDSSYEPIDKNVIYALDLLDRNNLMPISPFQMNFSLKCFYSTSMVDQLTYLFDSEVTKFDILSKDSVFNYSFVKGNLVGKQSRPKE